MDKRTLTINHKETGLPLSFALSVNKTVSKIGTGESKPTGIRIPETMVKSFEPVQNYMVGAVRQVGWRLDDWKKQTVYGCEIQWSLYWKRIHFDGTHLWSGHYRHSKN
jgi:hypothetical protein